MSTRLRWQSSGLLTRTMLWMLIIGYGVFLVGQSTYQNYRVNRDIETQRERITELQQRKKVLELSLHYYRSTAFKDMETRRRLNLKGKDEHVVSLPEAKSEPSLAIAAALPKDMLLQEQKDPPYIAWWNFFFGQPEPIKNN